MNKVLLGDVAEEVREKYKETDGNPAVVGLEHLIPGEIRLKEWSEDTNTTFTKAFHKGQVLFGRRRAYLKKAAVAPVDGICSGDITVISAKQDKILPELLPFVIQNNDFFDFAVGKSAGSLSPRVKWSRLKEYEFNLPSLPQQRKLAKLLWSFVDAKEAYEDLIHQTQISIYRECGRRCCVMARYKFDQIAFNSTDKKKPTDEDKEHYIGLEHLDSGSLQVTRWGSEIAPKGEKLLMKKGDVLFGKRRAYQKKVAIAPFDGIFSAHGMVLRPKTEVIDPDFFPLFIASDYFLDAAIKISVGSLSPGKGPVGDQ